EAINTQTTAGNERLKARSGITPTTRAASVPMRGSGVAAPDRHEESTSVVVGTVWARNPDFLDPDPPRSELHPSAAQRTLRQ
ncbi:MAG: hypothetical protein ACMG6S_17635, partial [Byssovorax sp.]